MDEINKRYITKTNNHAGMLGSTLITDSVNVLSRKQRVSIWVEGAYGTGKSHAVLTLKKLLDANEKDTKEYFDEVCQAIVEIGDKQTGCDNDKD